MYRTNPNPPCRVPLCVPGSRRIERCYATLGKGRGEPPVGAARVELVLVDDARDVWNVLGVHAGSGRFATDAVGRGAGWRILGWRMADGTRPLGDYEVVDPDLAQLEQLPRPDSFADFAPCADSA
ncbi:MAG TPA: hypothetical protein VFS55_09385 [Dokdonella sp.]|nr:hypothetical protein [Dokdonella sp.]